MRRAEEPALRSTIDDALRLANEEAIAASRKSKAATGLLQSWGVRGSTPVGVSEARASAILQEEELGASGWSNGVHANGHGAPSNGVTFPAQEESDELDELSLDPGQVEQMDDMRRQFEQLRSENRALELQAKGELDPADDISAQQDFLEHLQAFLEMRADGSFNQALTRPHAPCGAASCSHPATMGTLIFHTILGGSSCPLPFPGQELYDEYYTRLVELPDKHLKAAQPVPFPLCRSCHRLMAYHPPIRTSTRPSCYCMCKTMTTMPSNSSTRISAARWMQPPLPLCVAPRRLAAPFT